LGDPQVLEQRQADLERMLETMEAGLETRFAYANEVASLFTSNRGAAKELLGLWLRWWRDLLLIKEGADQYLHNADRLDDLRAYAAGLTTGQIARSIRRLTGAMTALDRNASARLALEVLMLELPSVGRFSPETAESPAG
jgi:DNA polymerase-3 subunit delta'